MSNSELKNRPKYIFAISWLLTFFVAALAVQLPLIYVDSLSLSDFVVVIFIQSVVSAYLFCKVLLFLYQATSIPYYKSTMYEVLKNKWWFSYKATVFFIVVFGLTFYNEIEEETFRIDDATFMYFMILLSPFMMKYAVKGKG
ncbi:hypothetical protein [Psychrobacter phenylpyruvicus]|uniref:Uncharacterized protein n=1 Tax=Psychrobacter phenylpyruvicus TaxID=29432 RepID=A0A379LNA7_9GAMM|nr:hypothetical protein [Psychrobacter phenylpyruvicus]SUD91931.1 Uncharacterised protein [Psychrobacter phenylpyruvicus]